MARSAGSRPARTLGALLAVFAVLYGLIGAGVLWSDAQWTPKLALDLEGGTEIVLTPVPIPGKSGTIDQNAIDQAVDIIRQRINGNGVSEAEITTQGSNISVSLPGKIDQKTRDLVEQAAQLRFRAVITATTGGVTPTTTATTTPSATGTATGKATAKPSTSATVKAPATSGATGSAPSATSSTNGMPVPRASALLAAGSTTAATTTPAATTAPASTTKATGTGTTSPAATPTVKPTDASDQNWVTQSLALQFEALDCTQAVNLRGQPNDDPTKPLIACSKDGAEKFILGPAEVLGSDVSSASASLETNSQGFTGTNWQVNLNFTSKGAEEFAKVTTRLFGYGTSDVRNRFAIVLDGLVISAPTTQGVISGGQAQITGSFKQADAQTLANQLKFGALPISFTKQTEQDISATLGGEQLRRGLLAGLIGLVLVVLYSLLQYRALGFVTVASLVIAGTLTYGLVVLFGWRQGLRLSLSGVAGLIVAIGITADSFIVFFERVRDEVRDGRPLNVAVETAWGRARRTILASDAVSFLAAGVLFLLAIGSVRGFAFTLGLTTIVDVVVVFLFTKPTVTLLSRTRFFGGGHKLSGFDAEHLGRSVAYAGRGKVRATTPAARVGTIAERRAAAARAAAGEVDPATSDPGAGPGGGPGAEPGGTPSGTWATESTAGSGRDN